jgi:predicted DNA-binding transcriptional regulator AlpA
MLDKMRLKAYNINDSPKQISKINGREREKPMEKEYYKPEEVMKLLSISKATLNRRAENGTIPSEIEEGRKRGRKYPKEAIDAHVKLLKHKNNAKLTFGLATNSELWASYQNHFRLYEPEDIVTYDKLLEWREANYDIFMSAREGSKRIAGVTMIPLEEDVIKSIINGEIREQNIQPETIREWTGKNLTVYIPSISIHHTGDAQKDKNRGRFIIRSAIKWAILLDRQYDIKKWYAVAATPEGKKLVEHLGFEKIIGKRDAYMLKDLKKATKSIKLFVDRLEEESESLVPSPKQK